MTERAEDGRFKRDLGVERTPREQVDRKITENRELTDEERLEMFRLQAYNDALPELPEIPGYHVCWLTTQTNSSDTIMRRMRLGYEPIRVEDVPGMEAASIKTGEWAGVIGINEMIAFKLKDSLYQAYMREAHYDAPNREEERLRSRAEEMARMAEQSGTTLIEDEGYQELRQAPPAPTRYE